MKLRSLWFAGCFALSFAGLASADTSPVEAVLKKALPDMKVDSVQASPMPGLYEVVVGPKVFYVSEDGRYIVQGELIDIEGKKDLTEERLSAVRLATLNKVGLDKMIIFTPKTSKKHVAYVFTDIDCGYCRKLHSEIDQYLKEGIELRYLFFPRAGENSASFDKAVSVWCAKDRNDAFTRAKKGEEIARKSCENPVKEEMQLALAMGAQGTPMIVTEQGEVLPGYVPAAQLAKYMDMGGNKQKLNPRQ